MGKGPERAIEASHAYAVNRHAYVGTATQAEPRERTEDHCPTSFG